jgi:hypothetical protein
MQLGADSEPLFRGHGPALSSIGRLGCFVTAENTHAAVHAKS